MDAEEVVKSAKSGDLIQIFRTGNEHWAIYVGDGDVVHISSEATGSPSTQDKSRVLRQKLEEVVGSGTYRINNRLDDDYEPRNAEAILKDANQMVGQEVEDSVSTLDRQHFVIGLRYRQPEPEPEPEQQPESTTTFFQTKSAVLSGVLLGVGAFTLLGASLISLLKKKQRQSDPKEVVKRAKPGDLIEVFRTGYEHWAIYVGDGDVIHFGSEATGSLISQDKSHVLRQKLMKAVGTSKCCINNRLDDKYEPRDIEVILRDADEMVGQEVPYSPATWNCEHFVTGLRYGKPESGQVRNPVVTGTAGLLDTIISWGDALISSINMTEEESKTAEKQQQQKV